MADNSIPVMQPWLRDLLTPRPGPAPDMNAPIPLPGVAYGRNGPIAPSQAVTLPTTPAPVSMPAPAPAPAPATQPAPAAAQAAPATQPAPAVSQNMPLPPDRFTPGPLTGVKVLEGVRRNSPVEEAVNPFKGMARIDAYNLIKQRPTQRPMTAQDMLAMKLMGLIENRAAAQGSPQANSDYMFEHLRNMYARNPMNVTLSDITRGGMPGYDEGY